MDRTVLLCLTALLACGCGSKNVCQQSCEKMKSCGEAKVSVICGDPKLEAQCSLLRKTLSVDCSAATDEACQEEYRAESERIVKCNMDPNTCYCPRSVCLEACDDQKNCAESALSGLACADPKNKPTCDSLNAMKQKDCYSIPDESCTGSVETAAKQITSCFIDRRTCVCPATGRDAGL